MLEDLDLNRIADERAQELIRRVLNLLEEVMADLRGAQAEIQRLRDENSRLNGEQGKPKIKPNKAQWPTDHSSEKERGKPKEWFKGSRTDSIANDREQVLEVDRESLPPDAQFKGYEDVVVQDVIFHTDNVLFHKEKFYCPWQHRTYLAPLPQGYSGQFGPGIKALALVFYFGAQISEPKVAELLRNVGVEISDGQMSNLLIEDQDTFHQEKESVYLPGLTSSPWQHMDETGTRANGQNWHCHIVCNPLYTAYVTTEDKDRLAVIDALTNGQRRQFLLDEEALGYLGTLGLSKVRCRQLIQLPWEQLLEEETIEGLLEEHLSNLGPQQKKWVLGAMAVAAYHAQVEFPVVRLLVSDDAPQFGLVTEELALCWVHEGWHYKKLSPWIRNHQELVEDFLKRFWEYYEQLLEYRQWPSREEAMRLEQTFDGLFATETGYWALDERIAKTRTKKECLLMVLRHPEIPLHNNPAALGALGQVRKRDVSFGPRTEEGVLAWDTFGTLAATARKSGVSFYHYIHDRVSGRNKMRPLAEVIEEGARELNLGASWSGL